MNNYSLLIYNGTEYKEVDIDDKIGIALSKQYEDLDDPTKFYTTWSKTVQLPMTAKNNAIFDKLYRPDQAVTDAGIDPRKKIPFVLLHNQEFIITGYAKVLKVDNSEKTKKYNITLYSVLGDIINDLKQLTFNADKATDPKYVLRNALTENCIVNRNLVKQCWEQETHTIPLENKTNLDFIGFLPTYQGMYDDFDSSKIELTPYNVENYWGEDNEGEVDEHYLGDYRSYYQQPYVWVDAIVQLLKEKIEEITDFKVNLDPSWFNEQNPYWAKAILTCPTLFNNEDETGQNPKETYEYGWNQYISNTSQQSDLSSHHKHILPFTHKSGDHILDYYGSGKFRAPQNGSAHFKESFIWTLFAVKTDPQLLDGYCRLKDDNNLFLEFRAVDAQTMENIPGAKKTFMFYSNSTEHTSGYDEAIDVGVSSRNHPDYVTTPDSSVVAPSNGYAWAGELNVEFDVNWNRPYYIICDQYARNNGDPFEIAAGSWIPRWDWLWTDLFQTYDNPGVIGIRGLYWYITNYNSGIEESSSLRSNSKLTMRRVWSFDENPFEYVLKYCKMFRLVFDLDEDAKTLSIMTRDRYFKNYTIEDWTRKLDKSKEYNIEPINFDKKYFNFKYQDGKGQRMEYYQDKYKSNYGAYKVNTGYDFNSDSNDIFEDLQPSMICTKKQVSNMFNTQFPDQPDYRGSNFRYMPKEYFVENDDDGKNAGNAGAFYFRDGRYEADSQLHKKDNNNRPAVFISDDTDYQIINKSYNWHLISQYLTTTNYLPAITPYINGYAFQIAQPAELYYNRDILNPTNVRYIYDLWWKKYLDERYSVQTKVLTAYFYLQANDFLNFKFNKFVMVDNVLYMVNKIYDFNLTTDKTTKVQLVQVNDIEGYTNTGVVFSYLYAANDNFNVRWDNISEVEVFSSSEWSIDSCSAWIWANKEGSKLQIRGYNINYGWNRAATIVLRNTDNLTYTLTVNVEPQDTYLTVPQVSLVFGSSSGTKQIGVNSNPANITVTGKSTWINTEIVVNPVSENAIRGSMFTINVSVANNPNRNSRQGNITITNGYDTATITVSQQGQRNIQPYVPSVHQVDPDNPDIERMNLVPGEAVPLTLYTLKQMKLNSTQISNGIVSVTSSNDIDTVGFLVQPEVSEQHTLEGKTSDGGVVTMETVDGELVKWNYNLGDVTQRYTVMVSSLDWKEGSVTVDSVTGTYFNSDEINTQHTITATAETDYTFVQWSDGDSNATRTITVTGDTTLYPIFAENAVLTTYNVTWVLTNAKSDNNASTVVENTQFRALLKPYNWYTMSNVSIMMGLDNITTQCYHNGTLNIPQVTGDLVITATADWGEWDYVWSAEENAGPKDFNGWTTSDPIAALPTVNGNKQGDCWVFTEGKFAIPEADILGYEMLCGLMPAAVNGDYPKFFATNQDSKGFIAYWDQVNNVFYTDLGRSAENFADTNQKLLYGKEPQLLVLKSDGTNATLTYGSNISIGGELVTENDIRNYIVTREDTAGCTMYIYAIRAIMKDNPVTKYRVRITAGSNGSVYVDSILPGNFDYNLPEGTQVNIKAVGNTNYRFVKWSDNNYNDTRVLTVNSEINLTAYFEKINPGFKEIFYKTANNAMVDLTGIMLLGGGNIAHITSHTYTNGRGVITTDRSVDSVYDGFQNDPYLTEVVFNGIVTTFGGSGCFLNDGMLQSVTMNGAVTLGGNTFMNSGIATFTMPSTVTTVGDNQFKDCTNLRTVNWGANVSSNGVAIFQGCTSLTTVNLNGGSFEINNNMFQGCTSLRTFEIPANTDLGDYAFAECINLQTLDFGASTATAIGSNAITKTALNAVKINDDVTDIKLGGISSNPYLDTIILGRGVVNINEYAFEDNPVLKYIYCNAATAPVLGNDVFLNVPEGGELHIPNGADYSSWENELPNGWTIVDDL